MPTRTRFRWLWWLVAYLSLGLGLIGIVLPLLPTVPFLLLSAYAAARGSQRLHARLLSDPRIGPMITDWQRSGAISRQAKWLAAGTMTFAAALLFLLAPIIWVAVGATAIMAVVCTWIWLRPEPDRPSSDPE